jgi:hypothetical protein
MGKTASVLSATEPLVEISNLVGIDKVKTRFEADGADLVVSFPYKEGEIEKVSYTIDNGYLNIVVKAGDQGLTFQQGDVKYNHSSGGGGGQLDAIFAVGVARLSDLQGMFAMDTLKDVTIVNIDNNQENQGFGDVVLVSPRFSSVSEQVTQLLADLNTEPDVDVAQNLLDGISFATDNFQSPQTSYLAFEMSGILMRQGAVRSRLQPAPRNNNRAFMPPVASNQMPQIPDRAPAMPQPRPQMPQQQMPQQQRRPQPSQQSQNDRRQQFEERRAQFQERRPQQGNSQNQPMPQPQSAAQPRPKYEQPLAEAPQPRFNQPVQQAQPVTQPLVQPMQQPMPQPAPMQNQVPQPMQSTPAPQSQPQNEDLNPPSDWLTPKVYKGSTNI